MLGSASKTWRKAWPRSTPHSGESAWQPVSLQTRPPLLQAHTPEHCEAGINGLRVGRASWNVRRGFFKTGERLPLETRRATAAFALPFATPAEKRVQKTDPTTGPREPCTQGRGSENGLLFFATVVPLFCFRGAACRIVHTLRRPQRGSGTISGQHAPQLAARSLPSSPTMTKPLKTHKRDEARG